ncbi:hypothetical protein O0555_21210 [Brevibacillus laterosporus]|uniref:hypothetical protein n=1 Tax=Brevibacillus laterosporus TaxID=1465 RepID=UPI00215D25A3|nr:hypothetical protein [Brevibacillus laterosporus]MCR8939823.1 hypothetical protein [Brevibacillus laterosporus]MCZ0842463.1 hypothetical protein [Brevibacillus laterosporus]MCZ0846460.1 hypothetical protein [Brevibacillus laterosporus]
MFDVKKYFIDRTPHLKPETLEKYVQRAERFIAIQDALGRELTDSEKRTLAWLSEGETETVANVQRIFDELSARVPK